MTITILDGGLGTSLSGIADTSPLWSGAFVRDAPTNLSRTHSDFIEAGARIIQTATYQISYATGERAGLTRGETEALMREAVLLAASLVRGCGQPVRGDAACEPPNNPSASDVYSSAPEPTTTGVEVALSLGPYGATLSPSCEFTGVYPPPFGSSPAAEAEAEDALTHWHLERLRVCASDANTWEAIDIIAFETIPLLCEMRAVRRAMGILLSELQDGSHSNGDHDDATSKSDYVRLGGKKWWISCTFPGPDARLPDPTASAGVGDIVLAVLGEQHGMPRPSGIGINCTPSSAIVALARELSIAVVDTVRVQGLRSSPPGSAVMEDTPLSWTFPWIILYPNGGEYSLSESRWLPNNSQTWASAVALAARAAEATLEHSQQHSRCRDSPRIIAGGCCNTSPADIEALACLLRSNA
ncbi:Homocysteine S-methyltransferase [Exidia glandulosa HHB12029]|uniref:Homocysteine S-methyltransferase n=1 Tax=Exidia glandulosa HHB12029 TaxID=1314781 RepID=A0A165P9A7_EXIGL|nr:Homocysteine S-methyltransferase [Exidia glandulosa HHB12029]